MSIQPGVGYSFYSSGSGFTLDSSPQFPEDGSNKQKELKQFECSVIKESDQYFLKTVRGVCNYTFSQFPLYPYWEGSGDVVRSDARMRKQSIMKDWAVYPTDSRDEGTDSASDFMASNGKVEIKNADSGGSDTWLVTISLMDYYDGEEWYPDARLIEPQQPFVSVFPLDSSGLDDVLLAESRQSESFSTLWISTPDHTDGGRTTVPRRVGYLVKKIAQLDWNSVSESWDVTQYLTGHIDMEINLFDGVNMSFGSKGDPNDYEIAKATQFDMTIQNWTWFEKMQGDSTWFESAYGVELNSSDWWTQVNS